MQTKSVSRTKGNVSKKSTEKQKYNEQEQMFLKYWDHMLKFVSAIVSKSDNEEKYQNFVSEFCQHLFDINEENRTLVSPKQIFGFSFFYALMCADSVQSTLFDDWPNMRKSLKRLSRKLIRHIEASDVQKKEAKHVAGQ